MCLPVGVDTLKSLAIFSPTTGEKNNLDVSVAIKGGRVEGLHVIQMVFKWQKDKWAGRGGKGVVSVELTFNCITC